MEEVESVLPGGVEPTASISMRRDETTGEILIDNIMGFEFHETDSWLTVAGVFLVIILVYCTKCWIDLQFAKRLESYKNKIMKE